MQALSRQLAAAQQQGSAAQQQSAQIAELSRQLEEAKQRENQLRAQVSKVEPSTETGSLQKIAGAASMPGTEPERATAMLTLAMQLHDRGQPEQVQRSGHQGQQLLRAYPFRGRRLLHSYSFRRRHLFGSYPLRGRRLP